MAKAYTIEKYPKELQKKVTLLEHFRNYLEVPSKGKTQKPMSENGELVYLKKWLKTKHAMLFRLSTRMIEVVFEDRTEIVLRSEAREFFYVSKRQDWEAFPLASALTSQNSEVAKRFKYAKEVLASVTNQRSGANTGKEWSKGRKKAAQGEGDEERQK